MHLVNVFVKPPPPPPPPPRRHDASRPRLDSLLLLLSIYFFSLFLSRVALFQQRNDACRSHIRHGSSTSAENDPTYYTHRFRLTPEMLTLFSPRLLVAESMSPRETTGERAKTLRILTRLVRLDRISVIIEKSDSEDKNIVESSRSSLRAFARIPSHVRVREKERVHFRNVGSILQSEPRET